MYPTQFTLWRGGRVVEGSGLENRRGFTPSVGSNPTLSANDTDKKEGVLRHLLFLYHIFLVLDWIHGLRRMIASLAGIDFIKSSGYTYHVENGTTI